MCHQTVDCMLMISGIIKVDLNFQYLSRPPRCMGEGFAVLQSSDVEIYYYHDEAG